jgi:hypothetical protein
VSSYGQLFLVQWDVMALRGGALGAQRHDQKEQACGWCDVGAPSDTSLSHIAATLPQRPPSSPRPHARPRSIAVRARTATLTGQARPGVCMVALAWHAVVGNACTKTLELRCSRAHHRITRDGAGGQCHMAAQVRVCQAKKARGWCETKHAKTRVMRAGGGGPLASACQAVRAHQQTNHTGPRTRSTHAPPLPTPPTTHHGALAFVPSWAKVAR